MWFGCGLQLSEMWNVFGIHAANKCPARGCFVLLMVCCWCSTGINQNRCVVMIFLDIDFFALWATQPSLLEMIVQQVCGGDTWNNLKYSYYNYTYNICFSSLFGKHGRFVSFGCHPFPKCWHRDESVPKEKQRGRQEFEKNGPTRLEKEQKLGISTGESGIYPLVNLVNIQKTIENGYLEWVFPWKMVDLSIGKRLPEGSGFSHGISDWWFGTWLLFFHILGIIIPTDELIFFRGVETTNQDIVENPIKSYGFDHQNWVTCRA